MGLLQKLRDSFFPPRSRQPSRLTGIDPITPSLAELPTFTLATADAMRFDAQVRIGLGARNGLLMGAEVTVSGDQDDVVEWVRGEWSRLWSTYAPQLLRAKLYGFQASEVVYRRATGGRFAGFVEVDQLIERPAREIRIVMRGHEPAGFVWRDGDQEVTLLAPRGLLVTFDSESGHPYGCSLLARAYPAWYEKWMEGGAKRSLRLRMMKDSYIGDIFWYPADQAVQLADGTQVSWRDVGRQLIEARQTGGALTLPLVRDQHGNRLTDYTPPRDTGGATQIFDWKKDLDLEIWKALEVPPEIIQAASTGSGYSGRWIPFMVALSAVQVEFSELLRCVDRDVLRPLAHLNFGARPTYEIRPRLLIDTYNERMGAKQTTPTAAPF